MALGSSPKQHHAQKKGALKTLDANIKRLRKSLTKARKSPKACRVAGKDLLYVGILAGQAFSEMKGVSGKTTASKSRKASGVGIMRARKALAAYERVCMKPAKKKAAKKK